MNILLVEPDYYTRYPSLGLLKLSAYHKDRGDRVAQVRGSQTVRPKPHRIYVASLFTWDWKAVWSAVKYYKSEYPRAEVWVGGIYASLLPDHAKLSGADVVWEGLMPEIEEVFPDYSEVPEWKSTVLFASRGCPRRCGFCSVPKLEGAPMPGEGSIKSRLHPDYQRAVFFDNNILGMPNWREVFEELIELGVEVDFNQGMDARLITDESAKLLSKMNIPVIRLAFDYAGIRPWVEQAIGHLKNHGIRGRRIVFYVLHNYVDSPQGFFERVRDLLDWGVVVYPMRYEPLCTLQKNQFVSPQWTPEELKMVAQARRVMGFGGALPPYKPLVEKFSRADTFAEAFVLRPPRTHLVVPRPIQEMALEHEQISSKGKQFFPGWRREKDWRKTVTAS